jgi:hypothetical protein
MSVSKSDGWHTYLSQACCPQLSPSFEAQPGSGHRRLSVYAKLVVGSSAAHSPSSQVPSQKYSAVELYPDGDWRACQKMCVGRHPNRNRLRWPVSTPGGQPKGKMSKWEKRKRRAQPSSSVSAARKSLSNGSAATVMSRAVRPSGGVPIKIEAHQYSPPARPDELDAHMIDACCSDG